MRRCACAGAGAGAAAASRRRSAGRIVRPPTTRRSAGACVPSRGSAAGPPRRQAALDEQLLRLLDRHARDAGLLIDPAVARAGPSCPRSRAVAQDAPARSVSSCGCRRAAERRRRGVVRGISVAGIASGDSFGSRAAAWLSKHRTAPDDQRRRSATAATMPPNADGRTSTSLCSCATPLVVHVARRRVACVVVVPASVRRGGSVGFMRERLLEERIVERQQRAAAQVAREQRTPRRRHSPTGTATSIQWIGNAVRARSSARPARSGRRAASPGCTIATFASSRLPLLQVRDSSSRNGSAKCPNDEQRARRSPTCRVMRSRYQRNLFRQVAAQMIRNCEKRSRPTASRRRAAACRGRGSAAA